MSAHRPATEGIADIKEQALAMADAGCDLVQRQALEVARERRLPLVVRAIASETRTVVN